MAKLISNTYAEALFELAAENNRIDDMYSEVTVLAELFSENPEFVALLNHPKITKEEKLESLDKTLKGRVSDELLGLLRVVVTKGRGREIGKIFEGFKMKVYAFKKIGIVHVTSAVMLDEAQKKKIEAGLLAKTDFRSLELICDVDPSLIGGMVIRIGDRVVDSSIKTKIGKMTAALRKTTIN